MGDVPVGGLYELLGSQPEASATELRADYERALAAAHRIGAFKRVEELVAAYELLSDPGRRHTYDTMGVEVPRERVPNTHGAAVPFRSVLPGLGQQPVPQRSGRGRKLEKNSGRERAERQAARAERLAVAGDAAGAARAKSAAERLQKGVEGEALTARLLDGLVPYGWTVLHDRRKSRTSPANLDHVVIGPPGVLVIDSKNWSGGRVRLDERGLAVGHYRKDDELQAVKIDGDIVRELVQQLPPGAPVCGVLALVQDMGLPAPVRHRDVFVVQRDQLWTWLWSLPPVLPPDRVAELGRALDQTLPPRTAPKAPQATTARKPVADRGRRRPVDGLRRPLAAAALGATVLLLAPHSTRCSTGWASSSRTP